MYYVYVRDVLAFDAAEDESPVLSASISQSVNAAAYLDMEVAPWLAAAEGDPVEVRWDATTLFRGRVTEVTQTTDTTWSVSAVSDVDRLNDVLARPRSTDGSVGVRCPSDPAAYVEWLVAQYDERAVGGYAITVGVNQADRLTDGELSISETSYETVAAALENDVLSMGGYLDFRPYSTGGTLDLWADVHEASDQLIDLGENVVSIEVTRTTDEQRTAVVPYATVDGEEVTLADASEAELAMVANAGLSVLGDAIYDPEAVARYGYREERVQLTGVADSADLVRAAVAHLRTTLAPTLTISCRAVDMALYREGREHLRVGQAVRVRSEPHGVDEYLVVQDMDLDLMDPSQTSYTLGVAYDTLTGQQSAFMRDLNGSIDHALDVVTDAEDAISKVINDFNVEYYLSDDPDEPLGGEWGIGNIVSVDNKYIFTHTKSEAADGTIITSEPTLVTPSIQRSLKLHRDLGDEVKWFHFVVSNSQVTDDATGMVAVSGQMGGWDASEQGAVTVAYGLQDSAYASGEGLAGVGIVTERSSDIDTSKVTLVSYVDQGQVSIYLRATGKITVSLYASGDGFSTPFIELSSEPSGTKVFDLADATTTYDSAILQADNAIRAYVAATYATQAGLGEVQSTFDIRANQIEAKVEEKMDTAVANETFVSQSTYDQFSDRITTTVSQVQATAEGASEAAQSALTKATEVEQTTESITSTVSRVEQTAEGAMTTATEAKQTADGFQVQITQAASDASSALGAAQSAQDAADAAQEAAEGAQAAAEDAEKVATNYLRFDSTGLCVGNLTGTLGYNTLIKSSGIDLRNGSTVLASFTPTSISLGANSTSSSISLCGGTGSITYQSGGYISLRRGDTWLGLTTTSLEFSASVGGTHLECGNQTVEIGGPAISVYAYCGTSSVGQERKKLTPVYRLNNPYATNTKMWTADLSERNGLISAGWVSEGTNGVGWYAFEP